MSRRWRLASLALAVLVGLPALLQAVFIAPHVVFIGDETRAGQVTVGNNGDEPEEITVDLMFGYPDTDSVGTPFIHFIEDPGAEYPSAAEWIRAFPRRMRLGPGDRQILRLLATPPANLPDGEYWARLIVTSRGGTIPVASTDTTVRAGLQLVFRLVAPVIYRKGNVSTGITLTSLEASVVDDSLVVWVAATRLGNAAYLGTAQFAVLTEDGTGVRDWTIPLAVYYPITRRFVFRDVGLPPGSYRLTLRLAAEREDIEGDHVLPAPPVGDTVAFVVP